MSTYPLFVEAFERGVKVNSIDPLHYVPPQEILEVLRDEKLRRAIHQAREDGLSVDRLMPRIDVNLWVSEKEVALIAFPKMDGSFDYLGFSSKDESAHRWCTDLFQHLWERAEPGYWDEVHLL